MKENESCGGIIERGIVLSVSADGYSIASLDRDGIITPELKAANTSDVYEVGDKVQYVFYKDGTGMVLCYMEKSKGNGTPINREQVLELVEQAKKDALLASHPVGELYISAESTHPAIKFGGGTWVQIKDTFLLAAGSTYAAGTTGGEATHTLTTAEMPSHNHLMPNLNNSTSDTRGVYVSVDNQYALTGGSASTGYWWYRRTFAAGSGGAHNNMPPFLAVYVWKRTA